MMKAWFTYEDMSHRASSNLTLHVYVLINCLNLYIYTHIVGVCVWVSETLNNYCGVHIIYVNMLCTKWILRLLEHNRVGAVLDIS